MPSKTVKVGSVSFTLYPWRHPTGAEMWRFAWHDRQGKRRYTTRADRLEEIKAARTKAREIHNGSIDLADLDTEKLQIVRAFLELNPTWETITHLKSRSSGIRPTIAEAIAAFHKFKTAQKGQETKHIKLLRADISSLAAEVGASTPLEDISAAHINAWLESREVGAKRTKTTAPPVSRSGDGPQSKT